MATTFLEPGGDADFGFNLWSTTVGPPTIVTDIVHGTHVKSIKFAPGAGQKVVTPNSVLADAGSRLSFYVYVNAVPTGGDATIMQFQTSGGSTCFMFVLSTAGVLKLTKADFTQIGSNGATLSTGKWYRISIAYTITSTTINRFEIFVDSDPSISVTNGTITATATSRVIWGNNDANAALDLRMSDFYADSSNALTDPGNIWVTAKRPNANGSLNEFTTQVGSGGSGYGSGHSPQVNERALSATNGWSISTTTKKTEEYSIEAQDVGDINIQSSTIVDFMGWIYASVNSTSNSPVHHIIVAGVATAKTMTTSAAIYTQIAGSTTYPAGNTDIGMDGQFASAHLTSLFECGIIVAYIPTTNQFFMMF